MIVRGGAMGMRWPGGPSAGAARWEYDHHSGMPIQVGGGRQAIRSDSSQRSAAQDAQAALRSHAMPRLAMICFYAGVALEQQTALRPTAGRQPLPRNVKVGPRSGDAKAGLNVPIWTRKLPRRWLDRLGQQNLIPTGLSIAFI